MTVCFCALSGTAHAWYQPGYGYPPYAGGPDGYYGNYGFAPNYHGYVKPRIYMRGRINRYGDYRMDVKIRDISKYDIYKAWIWYNYLRSQ